MAEKRFTFYLIVGESETEDVPCVAGAVNDWTIEYDDGTVMGPLMKGPLCDDKSLMVPGTQRLVRVTVPYQVVHSAVFVPSVDGEVEATSDA